MYLWNIMDYLGNVGIDIPVPWSVWVIILKQGMKKIGTFAWWNKLFRCFAQQLWKDWVFCIPNHSYIVLENSRCECMLPKNSAPCSRGCSKTKISAGLSPTSMGPRVSNHRLTSKSFYGRATIREFPRMQKRLCRVNFPFSDFKNHL